MEEIIIGVNGLRTVIAVLLNISQRSGVGAGMTRSARGGSVMCFEWSGGLDTALYNRNIPLPFYIISHWTPFYRATIGKFPVQIVLELL